MSMLKKAENKMAYAKIGLYGDAGSGKTVTAALLAIGLHKYAKLAKPIGMFDTEPGASFIIPLFEKAGIEFLVFDQSRALVDLMGFMREAEQSCSIAIMDSITHVWRDVQESYLKKINERNSEKGKPKIYKLEFHHWNAIKPEWAKFTDIYLHSKMHAIVCGRAGSIYEYQENDKGKKELITVGTKMATEKEMGYEPSLLIELMKHLEDGKIFNHALVEKDRSMNYNGMELQFTDAALKAWLKNPETLPQPFSALVKHFESLNLGGQHFDSMRQRDSSELFTAEGDNGWSKESREREIWCEEIEGLLVKHFPGQTTEAKSKKAEHIESVFGTRSWTKVQNLRSEQIKDGFEQLKYMLEPPSKELDPNADVPEAA